MKQRLDVAITEKGLVSSREQAKSLIMAGVVYVNGQKSDKAGTAVNEDDNIEIRGQRLPYVSRGGLKLEKAIREFGVKLDDCICIDIGASTGGFTDCML
ncbi:MAG: S4 domain-containing protein, partial [Oscillospiraceae bacterium]